MRKSINDLSEAINAAKRDATEDEKEDEKEEKKEDEKGDKKPNYITWFWVIAAISVIALGLAITSFFIGVTPYVRWNVETVSLSIILAFVGILATFVVIGNYMQVRDVKSEFDSKVDKIIKESIKKITTATNERINELERLIPEDDFINDIKFHLVETELSGPYKKRKNKFFIFMKALMKLNPAKSKRDREKFDDIVDSVENLLADEPEFENDDELEIRLLQSTKDKYIKFLRNCGDDERLKRIIGYIDKLKDLDSPTE
jgi:hypothetical protein